METKASFPNWQLGHSLNATTLPKGDLVCHASGRTDVAIFFLLNYLLHAFTVVVPPGTTTLGTIVIILTAIFLPYSGFMRAYEVIVNYPRGEENDLDIARKSGALCTIVLSSRMKNLIRSPVVISPLGTRIHGEHPVALNARLPKPGDPDERGADYCLVQVPSQFSVEPLSPQAFLPKRSKRDGIFSCISIYGNLAIGKLHAATEQISAADKNTLLPCNYSFFKPVAAIVQILYSSFELSRASGRQIDKFGYAAYALTVIPYVLMAVTNLIAALCAPQYPCMFIVLFRGASAGGEGRQRGAEEAWEPDVEENVKGAVGTTFESLSGTRPAFSWTEIFKRDLRAHISHFRNLMSVRSFEIWYRPFLLYISWTLPYLVIYGFTGFKKGQSNISQRAWVMSWLVLGQFSSIAVQLIGRRSGLLYSRLSKSANIPYSLDLVASQYDLILAIVVYSIPAVGSFVVVAKMIMEDGICRMV